MQRELLWDKLNKEKAIIIYGAQIVAFGVYKAIKEVLEKEVLYFAVSNKTDNPENIEGIPVKEFHEIKEVMKSSLVIVATPQVYHERIWEQISEYHVKNVIYVDTHIEYLIMSQYYRKLHDYKLLEDIGIYEKVKKEKSRENQFKSIGMYMARCHVDPILKNQPKYSEWIKQIQVGAALTDRTICRLKDNVAENISVKNRNYSELTATYWVWKHAQEGYKGICHYRRIFELENEDIQKVLDNNVNVILPLPFVCNGDTSAQYGRYISKEDQKLLFQALREVSPQYALGAETILKDKYLYNYNMLLADAATFDNYCKWLFPILSRAEELCEPGEIVRKDRYIGYFGEVLTALYFLYNKNNLNIVHAKKKWLV